MKFNKMIRNKLLIKLMFKLQTMKNQVRLLLIVMMKYKIMIQMKIEIKNKLHKCKKIQIQTMKLMLMKIKKYSLMMIQVVKILFKKFKKVLIIFLVKFLFKMRKINNKVNLKEKNKSLIIKSSK